ncbi:MAG: family 78 glycoside hydrolase catalytic domain [Verrucomicrobia bacterium]|nr:family 78 glycoside hydrolase catalytic domain [Verrucomicrobiota bacterium]
MRSLTCRWLRFLKLAALSGAVLVASSRGLALEAVRLRCDAADDPLGVDATPPRLSWQLQGGDRGARQTAWQVIVASGIEALAAGRGDVWDSGRREGDEQLHVPYAGRTLRSSEQVFWKVRVWDEAGRPGPWSQTATWTMGLLAAEDWRAAWITDPELLRWVRSQVGYRSLPVPDDRTPKWVSVDLGASHVITAVRLSPMRQVIEEMQGFPLRFKVEVAEQADFADAKILADYSSRNFAISRRATAQTLPAPAGGLRGRFVRLVTSQLKRDGAACYLALSQLEVIAGGRNVAAGRPVAASDSLEDKTWSRVALTDGLEGPGINPRESDTLLVRREFRAKAGLRRALVHASGLGHFELRLNGRKVGEDLLAPGWTAYDRTVLYDTHDVTALVQAGGANAIGLVLAGGFYNTRAVRYVKLESLFRPLTAICQVRLEYADGTTEIIGTDARWKVAPGPTTFANMFGGEDFDARRVPAGWDAPGFDDSRWTAAVTTSGPGGTLRGSSHAAPPVRAFDVLRPVSVQALRPGVAIYDLGQNASLMPRLRVRGPAGSSVRLIPAELLAADGSLDRRSVGGGGGDAWWQYTLRGPAGAEAETWFPQFFYHGARYLQVELQPGEGGDLPVVESLEGVVVHTSSPAVGEFACSNELFNRIRTLIRWAQRSNLVSLITDCPHREKLGWLEQYHLNGPALRYEFDLARLYTKTFGDMAAAQLASGLVPDIAPEYVIFTSGFRDSPEWGSAFLLAAWQHLEWTGDDTPIRRYYDGMKRYVAYLGTKAEGDILDHGLGDWYDLGPKPPGRAQLTPIALTATAMYAENLRILGVIAQRLGRAAEAAEYAAAAARVRGAFNRKFYDAATGSYATGSQCANALPLVFDLVEAGERPRVVAAVVRDVEARGLTAGDVGYRYLLRALGDAGRSDVVFTMNNQSEKPGYGYQLARGATSLTEAWDARPTSSHNHFMLGQIMEWFYRDLAGIGPDPVAPGFKHVVVRPQPVGDLTWVRAAHDSPRGRIRTAWRREGGSFQLELTLPPGTTATVYVPCADGAPVFEGEGENPAASQPGLRRLRREAGAEVYAASSGSFRFRTGAVRR